MLFKGRGIITYRSCHGSDTHGMNFLKLNYMRPMISAVFLLSFQKLCFKLVYTFTIFSPEHHFLLVFLVQHLLHLPSQRNALYPSFTFPDFLYIFLCLLVYPSATFLYVKYIWFLVQNVASHFTYSNHECSLELTQSFSMIFLLFFIQNFVKF